MYEINSKFASETIHSVYVKFEDIMRKSAKQENITMHTDQVKKSMEKMVRTGFK